MKDLLLAAAISTFLFGAAPAPGQAQPPPNIGDRWFRSAPADQGLDNAMVQQIFNRVRSQSDFRTVRGVVIVRHGTLVAEAYFGDFTSTSLKNVHSARQRRLRTDPGRRGPTRRRVLSSGLSHVIAEVNNRASGQSHLAFVQKHLFGPLGITTATDTLHDRVVVYRNPPGEICGRGDSKAFPQPAGATAGVSPASVETDGACPPGALCLLDGRFEVTAEWTKADGESGVATPLPGADATGYMWFFSPGNIELAVKALDGTTINNAFWVFAAGLTDVDYQLTVTDTVAGVSKTYSNPSRPFCGLGDTSAFPQ